LFVAKDTSEVMEDLLGGDFAGLSATFNPMDGKFIPLPEYLVPEALLEWGQEPKCLEVLVSESFIQDTFERNSVTVLPTIGCGIDNLETMKKNEVVDLDKHEIFFKPDKNGGVISLDHQSGEKSFRFETIFGMKDKNRMRVILDLVKSDTSLIPKSPLVLALERKTSDDSSGGTIADGGGLDGRTVSQLLGPELAQSKTFVEEDPTIDASSPGDDGETKLCLPGNISISYTLLGEEKWRFAVIHEQDGVKREVTRYLKGLNIEKLDAGLILYKKR
jgi:hypothetical protein